MESRNEYLDYFLGKSLTGIRAIRDDDSSIKVFLSVFTASQSLDAIIKDNYRGFELCTEQINKLFQSIKPFLPDQSKEWDTDKEIPSWETAPLTQELDALETALSIQFSQLNTFRVTSKGTHDVRKLIERPEESFGKYWKGLSRLAQEDWKSGAKCLAFELSTACGFHVVRSLEAVTVNYLEMLKATVTQRDLGTYVKLLREKGVCEEATDMVEQIRKHHRNPLMHPEDILDVPSAMSLFDMCRAAIISLVTNMHEKQLVLLEEMGEQALLPLRLR